MAKRWSTIVPSLIGSNYIRYEIIFDYGDKILAWPKIPSKNMEQCDRCPGPHRNKNLKCSQTMDRAPYIRGPDADSDGFFLYDLYTMKLRKGLWKTESDEKKTPVVLVSCN